MTRMTSLAPVLPVADVASALENYALLGFRTRAYQRADIVPGAKVAQVFYGFADRDGIAIHLCEVADLNPAANLSEVYIYVEDAPALHEQWSASGAVGTFIEPTATEYGLCEGAYLDLDGNSLRYGSWLPGYPKAAQV